MRMRTLGRAGLVTSAVGLNCASFTVGCGVFGDADARHMLAQLPDMGINLLDVTDFTGEGATESLVGGAIAGYRDSLVLTTCGGAMWTSSGTVRRVDARPAALIRACEATLRHLGTDYLDVFYLAALDQRVPLADSLGALAGLVAAGKVRHIGLSDVTATRLRDACASHPISAVSVEYSLMRRSPETDLLPAARALGVGVVARTPLARGLLTGWPTSISELDPDDYRHADQRFAPEHFTRNQALTRRAGELAATLNLSMSRLALAWLLSRDDALVAMPGTRSITHLEMDASAADVVLGRGDQARLSRLMAPARVAGAS